MYLMIDIQPNNQFTKYAKDYEKHNIIQQIISKALIRDIKTNPQNILELGSGSGQVIIILIGITNNILQLTYLKQCVKFILKKII